MPGHHLKSKTALVTGGSRRIGRAISGMLASRGANVIVHYHTSADAAESLAETLRGMGVKSWTVCGDLSDATVASELLDNAERIAGPVDLLVNNASIFPRDRLGEMTEESLSVNLRVNALAPFALVKSLAKRGREGAVVNLLDTRVLDYDREHVSYHLSKRMLFSLTRMAALEFAPALRINAVAPGLILPPAGKDASYLQQLSSTNPMNEYGAVEHVATTVGFLLESTFITGQVIFVDGGRHMLGGVYG